MDKAYELYDTFIEDGNTMMDLVPIIFEVFKVSGFFKEEDTADTNLDDGLLEANLDGILSEEDEEDREDSEDEENEQNKDN